MCGIAGWFITDPSMVTPDGLWSLSRCLLVGIQSRGRNATGYAYVKENGYTNFAKSPIEAKEFIKVPGHLLFEQQKEMPMNMLLHARFATQGEPSNNQNNHPLYSKISGLCMIHNGWFVNDAEVKEQFSLKPDAEVDSEVYLRLIEKFYIEGDVKSIEVAIKEATKCLYGNIACAMIQGGKPNIMYLWRDRGDLVVIQTEFGYVFASTMNILVNAIGCLSTFNLASWKLFHVPQSTLVKFEINHKPKLCKLVPIELENAQYSEYVITQTVDGEEKLRRKPKGSPITYYYGNTTTPHYDISHFNGYNSNKGYFVSGTPDSKSQQENSGTPKTADKTIIERPKNHHFKCQCNLCTEWWKWNLQTGELTAY